MTNSTKDKIFQETVIEQWKTTQYRPKISRHYRMCSMHLMILIVDPSFEKFMNP